MSDGICVTTLRYGRSYRSMILRVDLRNLRFEFNQNPLRIQKARQITHFVKSRKMTGIRKVQHARISTAMLLAGSSYTPRVFRVGWFCSVGADARSGSSSSEEAESCSNRASSSGSSSSSSEDDDSMDLESDPSPFTSWDCSECPSSRPGDRLIGEESSESPSPLCRNGSGEIA